MSLPLLWGRLRKKGSYIRRVHLALGLAAVYGSHCGREYCLKELPEEARLTPQSLKDPAGAGVWDRPGYRFP